MICRLNDGCLERRLRPVLRGSKEPTLGPSQEGNDFGISHSREGKEQASGKPDKATSFLASLLIPGSGQIMRGHIGWGLLFLMPALTIWFWPGSGGWQLVMIHIAAGVNVLALR